LLVINEHPQKDHVILIDDARCLGQDDYPTLEELTDILLKINPKYCISVRDDIVFCEPPLPSDKNPYEE